MPCGCSCVTHNVHLNFLQRLEEQQCLWQHIREGLQEAQGLAWSGCLRLDVAGGGCVVAAQWEPEQCAWEGALHSSRRGSVSRSPL